MKVYLSGPIFDCNDNECKEWRDYCSLKLDKLDIESIDPLCRDTRTDDTLNFAEIVKKDKQAILEADILIIRYMPNKQAVGTYMETLFSYQNGKYNILVNDSGASTISPWLEHHVHFIVYSFDEAITLVKHIVAAN